MYRRMPEGNLAVLNWLRTRGSWVRILPGAPVNQWVRSNDLAHFLLGWRRGSTKTPCRTGISPVPSGDVIPRIDSVMIWIPILPGRDRIHDGEALYGRANQFLSAGRGGGDWGEGPVKEVRVFRDELRPVEVPVWRDVGVGRQSAA